MKRWGTMLLVAIALAVGVDMLGDLTQDRPDRVARGSRSEIILEVSNRSVHATAQEAAAGLWAVCQGTVNQQLAPPGVVPVRGDRFLLVTEPAVGEHGWRRLKGCLEDLSVDRTLAKVVAKRDTTRP